MLTSNTMTLAVSQDVDLGRVVVIILFLIGGFVQWLIKWWKEKAASGAPDFNVAEKVEELKASGKAWLKQTGQDTTSEAKPPALPNVTMIGEVRHPGKRKETQPPHLQSDPPERVIRLAAAAAEPSVARRRHPLMSQVVSIGGLRRAIILNEILGPPKALQNESRQIN